MLNRLRLFLDSPEPTLAQVASVLRSVFLLAFAAQFTVAMLCGFLLRLFFDVDPARDGLLGWVLVIIAVPHLPLSLALGVRGLQGGSRGSALNSTLMSAVLLSTPAWFLALGLATRQPLQPMFVLTLLMAMNYAIGIFLAGRFARLSIKVRPETEDGEEG